MSHLQDIVVYNYVDLRTNYVMDHQRCLLENAMQDGYIGLDECGDVQ